MTMDVFTCFLLVAKIIVLSLNSPNTGAAAFWDAITYDPAAPILILYGLVFTVFQGLLLEYHLVLCYLDQTTNENKKGIYRGKKNPHSKGCWKNMFDKFFGVYKARYIKFHRLHEHLSSDDMQPLLSDDEVPMMSFEMSGKNSKLMTEIIEL